jgi:hypothetical protein
LTISWFKQVDLALRSFLGGRGADGAQARALTTPVCF